MAAPGNEVVLTVGFTTAALAAAFGHDMTFWTVVAAATLMKLITSDPLLDREGNPLARRAWWLQLFANMLAAILPPYMLTQGTAEILDVRDSPIFYLIAVFWVIAGEGLIRWLRKASADPKELIKIIKFWKNGS